MSLRTTQKYSSRPRSPPPPPRRSRRYESPEPSRERFDTQRRSNVLQLMETYEGSPLGALNKYRKSCVKAKVWIRNFIEIRRHMTGYIVAFDKHWNLIMRDVTDIFLVSKRNRGPFTRDVESEEEIPDIPVKVPKKCQKSANVSEPPPPPNSKNSKNKTKHNVLLKFRHVDQIFIRGSSIGMISPLTRSHDEDDAE